MTTPKKPSAAKPKAGAAAKPKAPAVTPQPQQKPDAFEDAFGFVTRDDIEGDYVNDPRDPGGETKHGISKRSYPKVDIAALTLKDAKAIYRRDFWDALNCEEMPRSIAISVFDCGVNQGTKVAARLIQKAARVSADGIIGPITLAAIADADPVELVADFLSWRLRRYAGTANAHTFMRGWSRRVILLAQFLVEPEATTTPTTT